MNAFHITRPVSRLAFSALSCIALVFAFVPNASAQQDPLVGYEDIDIFANPPLTADLPNVLIILDTSANWSASVGTKACKKYADDTLGPAEDSSKAGIEKCGLVNALWELDTGKFNIGLLYLNSSSASGGYPRTRFLKGFTEAHKKILMDEIKETTTRADIGDQASNADISSALWEAYLWYNGMDPLNGRAQDNIQKRLKIDFNAFLDGGSGKYDSPSKTSCARNFIILMANGPGAGTEVGIRDRFVAAGGNGGQITYPTKYMSNSAQNNWADETARFLRGVDVSSQDGTQNIITYTLAVTDPSKDKEGDYVNNYNYIKEIAVQGGGRFYEASDSDSVAQALKNIFNQIQAVNSVFASASLPVSVNAQGTFLNQVFMGMFRPDLEGKPRWAGNLKQYQFGYDAGTQRVQLVDALGSPAVNPGTGFINPGAQSFWTTDIADFWRNKQWPGEVNAGLFSDAPDGQIVEKGGAAQRLRDVYYASRAGRNLYTCAGSCGSLLAFNTTNVSQTDLGVGSPTERDALVAWTRGTDNKGDEGLSTSGTHTVTKGGVEGVASTVRGSIHGDVIHSSPAVINFGGSNGVVVFYGTNAGTLHAVRGERTGVSAGNELWSFIPKEFLPRLKRLRDNAPVVKFATTNTSVTPAPERKDYGMDGPVTFYQNLGSAGKTYIFAAMRRGGRALYAFDVSNPAVPALLWKVDQTTAGLADLGQTWSEARVARIKGITDPVIIMGGGYDPAEDSSPPASPTMGHIVAVLNARTGEVLRVFTGFSRPVPASVAIVDADGDRAMDRAYAVDLSGSVYRMTFPGVDPSTWVITRIADFSGSSGTSQKMFYAPSVVPTSLGGTTVYAVQVGTGDREKPLLASGTENRFYTVLDRGQGTAKGIGDLVSMTETGISSIPSDKFGCYYNLPLAGEKIVNAVTYTSGFAFFGTNAPTPPSANSCTGSLGLARSYAIPALCGPVTISNLEGGGFPPTAVVGTVLIPPPAGPDGVQVDCDLTPAACRRAPIGIGVSPPDCQGNPSTVRSAIGATNIYACAPKQRLRRDWSVPVPR